MLLELGPLDAAAMQRWSRVARRLLLELRVDPGDLDGVIDLDFLDTWARLIDQWEATAREPSPSFHWAGQLECEMAEYLIHGLERILASDRLRELTTIDEVSDTQPITMHLIDRFCDCMCEENAGAAEFTATVRERLLAGTN